MPIKVSSFSGVKVYNLSSGVKGIPELLSRNKKRALAKESEHSQRVDLIQDFEMPAASQTLTITRDAEHIILTGTYPPMVKCFTVSDLGLKFQRGLTSEVVATQCLSDDFGKLCFLQSDRNLSFHAPYGKHYSIRVPVFGRTLEYNWENCDLYVGAAGNEVYRLNLEAGSFREPFTLGFEGCNKLSLNPVHRLLACGGENAACEFWDARARKAVAKIKIDDNSAANRSVEITSLKFDTDGLMLAVGSSQGK